LLVTKTEIRQLQRRLDRQYGAVPDGFDTAEQWARERHQDLGCMTLPELLRERDRVRARILFDPAPASWWLQRVAAIDEVIGRAA
jgi:hypothetical protein